MTIFTCFPVEAGVSVLPSIPPVEEIHSQFPINDYLVEFSSCLSHDIAQTRTRSKNNFFMVI